MVAFESAEVTLNYALWFLAAVAVRALSLVALDTLAQRGGARVKSELRRTALDALGELGPAYMERASSSQVTTLLSKGIDALDVYFGRYLPQLFLTAIQMPLILAVLWLTDLPTGIAVTLALPVIPVFMVLIGLATQTVQKKQWEGMQSLAKAFLDVVEGLPTLKIFGRHWRQVARIREVTGDFRKRTMAVLRVSFLSSFVLELAASLSVAIVAVSVGIRLIDGALPLWLGLFVLVLIPELYLPLRQVGAQFHQAADGLAASEELFAIIEQPRPVRPAQAGPARPGDLPRGTLVLSEFQAVRDGRPVHEPVQLKCQAGQITVLEGPSGAGKSSLVAALLGFTDYRGEITVDGSLVDGETLRELISWVPQSPQLFAGTIAGNVALGDAEPEQALVRRSLDLAGLSDIDPSGELGVAGAGVSGGQAQRIALARAYYRVERARTPYVILDEVTSALDQETEDLVWAGVQQLANQGVAVLLVSHRLRVNERADQRVAIHPLATEVIA